MSKEEQEENMDKLEDELLLSILITRRKKPKENYKKIRDHFGRVKNGS